MNESKQTAQPGAEMMPKLVSSAMAAGLTVGAGAVLWRYIAAARKIPTADAVRGINSLTIFAMIIAVLCIAASEIAWRWKLRRGKEELSARIQAAFMARMACREGSAILGLLAAYTGAEDGVLRAYPAYWVNMVPYALFIGFLSAHWPSAEKLDAEAREILS